MPNELTQQDLTHIVVCCDESGSKGYADRDEQTPGEVGLLAGLSAPKEVIDRIQSEFDSTVREYAGAATKLHITDLPPDQQAALRRDIFDLLRRELIPCFWEAIHVAGFHRAFQEIRAAAQQARAARRSRIKLSGQGPKPPSLHVALFEGFYSKILAYCLERERLRLHIEVRTDEVDRPIAKRFKDVAKAILDYGAKIERVTGFDPDTQGIVEGDVVIGETPEAAQVPIVVEHLELKIVNDRDGVVVAADILSNSLNYHFRNRSENDLYKPLNTPEAVASHPLVQCLDAFENWGDYELTDALYRHPQCPA